MDYLNVQVDNHGITIYTTHNSVDPAHHDKIHTKVGKGGIISKKHHLNIKVLEYRGP